MADSIRVHSGGQDLTPHATSSMLSFVASHGPEIPSHHHHVPTSTTNELTTAADTGTPHTFSLSDAPPRLPWTSSLVVVVVCELGLLTSVRNGWNSTDDGAGVVPLIALTGVALAAMRWRPNPRLPPARGVSVRLAIGFFIVAATLATYITIADDSELWLGPVLTLGISGTYLALWGFRSLALLRSMLLLSLLTWKPIAEGLHDIVRSTLDQPSALVYERLARLPIFGVEDEPWRLFTASLHRGSVVAIATVVLAVAVSRLRLSARVVIDLVVTTSIALVVHHIVVLASPIDTYDPAEVAAVATNPTLEIGISAVAVAALVFIRSRREHASDDAGGAAPPVPQTSDRDPVIFTPTRAKSHPVIVVLLLTSVAPLVVLAMGL